SHSQYLILNAYNVSFIASLLILTIGVGVLFAWTRSLIPCMVAHGIINVPMTPFWQSLLLAAFVVGAIVLSRRGLTVLKHVLSHASVPACIALGLIGIIWAIGARHIEHLQWAAAA